MCGASYPRFSLAWQIYIRDYLLQLEKKSGTVVDKLATLIGKEHDAVIVALACDVAFEFCHEGFYAQVDGVGSDFFADNVGGERRHKFFAGFKDKVEFGGKEVQIESKVYILLNKPKNCVTTSDDPQERLTVMDLVKNACTERIYPVGRLDRNTTGVLLLTNDGDLASKLTHPSFKKKKIYHVWLDKNVAIEDMEKIANGLDLEDGEVHADAISYASEDDKSQVGIEIHSGRNRIVRRIFEALGYHVIKLDRVYFAGLTKKNLGRGKWRYLNEKEVNALRMGAFE